MRRAAITQTKHKKCVKYNSLRPIILDRTFLRSSMLPTYIKYVRVHLAVEYNNESAMWYACTSSYCVSGITILKPTVSLAKLPCTESAKIAIVTLTVPRLSLSTAMDRKKAIMLFSYYNVMETGFKLEEWEIFMM